VVWVRLRPGLRVLRRAADEVQIGTDPRWAVRLTDLTAGEVQALTAVDDGAALPPLPRLDARVDDAGRPRDAVVDLLRDARVLVDPAPRRSTASASPLPSGASADAAVWSLVLDEPDGAAMVRARADRVVGFLGAGRLALTAAVTLASAGVGTVLLDDPSPVTTGDLGVGGFGARDVGSPRAEAAARVLRDLVPQVRTSAADRTRPDVVVTVEHAVADGARARTLMAAEVVHLSVVLREADVLVGPLVRPGTSPCLRCLDLHRTEADPAWPVLAAQLATAPRHRVAREESVLAAVGGALAAAAVLAELDGRTPAVVGSSFEIAVPDVVPRLRVWPVHPECGCTGLPVARVSPAGRPPAGG
jgi:bacteriocin biosynthesis cyclodehydratase domain-containing protein